MPSSRTASEIYPHRHGGEFTVGTNGPECTACGLTANEYQLVQATLEFYRAGVSLKAIRVLDSMGICMTCGARKCRCSQNQRAGV